MLLPKQIKNYLDHGKVKHFQSHLSNIKRLTCLKQNITLLKVKLYLFANVIFIKVLSSTVIAKEKHLQRTNANERNLAK